MTTIKNISFNLINNHHLSSLYRFQGNVSMRSSMKLMDIDESKKSSRYKQNCHIYFSRNFRHHKYFIHKRLRQTLNILFESEGLPKINKESLYIQQNYDNFIKSITNNSESLQSESIRILITPKLAALLSENYILQQLKKHTLSSLPELTDARKFGGSYGITGEWLQLLNNLTLFYGKTLITYEDIINYIYTLRLNHSCFKKSDTTEFIDKKMPSIILNTKLYSPYHKYTIMDSLERVIEKKAYNYKSDLGANPNQIIKEIIEEYMELRNKILEYLENNYNNKFIKTFK